MLNGMQHATISLHLRIEFNTFMNDTCRTVRFDREKGLPSVGGIEIETKQTWYSHLRVMGEKRGNKKRKCIRGRNVSTELDENTYREASRQDFLPRSSIDRFQS